MRLQRQQNKYLTAKMEVNFKNLDHIISETTKVARKSEGNAQVAVAASEEELAAMEEITSSTVISSLRAKT